VETQEGSTAPATQDHERSFERRTNDRRSGAADGRPSSMHIDSVGISILFFFSYFLSYWSSNQPRLHRFVNLFLLLPLLSFVHPRVLFGRNPPVAVAAATAGDFFRGNGWMVLVRVKRV
jgi:hypothetical protein